MKKIINKSQWDATCKGFIFTGCAIRSNNVACIIARKDLTEEEVNKVDEFDIPTRILTVFEKEGSDSLSVAGSQLIGYSLPKVAVSQKPMNLGFVLSSDKNSAVVRNKNNLNILINNNYYSDFVIQFVLCRLPGARRATTNLQKT